MWKLFNKKPAHLKEESVSEQDAKQGSAEQKKSAAKEQAHKAVAAATKKQEPSAAQRHGAKEKKNSRFDRGDGILIRPLVSEKSATAGSHDIYAFVVTKQANKVAIKKAFAAMYQVHPVSVRLCTMPAKRKQSGRIAGVRSGWKKAYVRVPSGSVVQVYEGV